MNPFLLGYPFCCHIIFHKVFFTALYSCGVSLTSPLLFLLLRFISLFWWFLLKFISFAFFSKKTISFLYFISAMIFVISFLLLPSIFFLLFLVSLHVQMNCVFEGFLFVCFLKKAASLPTSFLTSLVGSHRFSTVYFYLYMSSIFFVVVVTFPSGFFQ